MNNFGGVVFVFVIGTIVTWLALSPTLSRLVTLELTAGIDAEKALD